MKLVVIEASSPRKDPKCILLPVQKSFSEGRTKHRFINCGFKLKILGIDIVLAFIISVVVNLYGGVFLTAFI